MKQAKKIAIVCMENEMHKFAVDANIVKATGHGSPSMMKAHERYIEIAQAIKILESLPEVMF